MSAELKVGDVLWSWGNRGRDGGWGDHAIVGETRLSWLIKPDSWRPEVPVRKTDLTSAPSDRSYSNQRKRFYTTAQKDQQVADSEFRKAHEEEVMALLRWNVKVDVLRIVHAALVAAGKLPGEKGKAGEGEAKP